MRAMLLDPRGLALGRTAAGVTMLTQPRLAQAVLGVDPTSREGTGWVVQMLGAREVALGLGALVAKKDRRLWHTAGLLCDTADAVAVALALRQGLVRRASGAALVAVASSAVVIGASAVRRG